MDAVVTVRQNSLTEGLPRGLEHLSNDPAFHTYMKKLVSEEIRSEKQAMKSAKRGKGKDKKSGTPVRQQCNEGNRLIKSPSDTTLYTPAMRQIPLGTPIVNSLAQVVNDRGQDTISPAHQATNQIECIPVKEIGNSQQLSSNETKRISDFIQGIWLESNRAREEVELGDQNVYPGRGLEDKLVEAAKEKSRRMIIDAERFCATVNNPPGIEQVNQLQSLHSQTQGVVGHNFWI